MNLIGIEICSQKENDAEKTAVAANGKKGKAEKIKKKHANSLPFQIFFCCTTHTHTKKAKKMIPTLNKFKEKRNQNILTNQSLEQNQLRCLNF